jgi:hypothetical protein
MELLVSHEATTSPPTPLLNERGAKRVLYKKLKKIREFVATLLFPRRGFPTAID